MSDIPIDVTGCDLEPIETPGSIQPHGMMLVVEAASGLVRHVAGAVEERLGTSDWLDRPVDGLIGDALAQVAGEMMADSRVGFVGRLEAAGGVFDVSLQISGRYQLIELEPAPPSQGNASAALSALETASLSFARAMDLTSLCERAAVVFRTLTGFDRVMVYRFLDDDAGAVLAESKREDLRSFLNHRFPGSDIPRQARTLYVRNMLRVIPDATYTPAPLRPEWREAEPLDLSDASLRSVSPIHLQYLRNMGVTASASMSIVKDGVLWGLIACHHSSPRPLGYDTRVACRTLAGGLAARIKAQEEAGGLRDRVRLRGFEDEIVDLLTRAGSLENAVANHVSELRKMMTADGVAVIRGDELLLDGAHPSVDQVRRLAAWVSDKGRGHVFATDRLGSLFAEADAYREAASGLLTLTMSAEEPWIILWFRAEEVQIVDWAGNPHKDPALAPGDVLNPRASFDAWREALRGRARRWALAEIEAAGRLRPAVLAVRQNRRIRDLNVQLTETVADKDLSLQQKEYLIGEVNHRVQNSLQLVSGFLAMQSRESGDAAFHATVEEARRRIQAVALVHRRLYRGDQLEFVDAARYLEELCGDTVDSMGAEWGRQLVLDLAPMKLRTDRAVSLGLLLTELMINANKYAYDGAPGPLIICLAEDRARLRLTVADQGRGRSGSRKGFGTRMMEALVAQLGGELAYEEAGPGLRVVLSAPLD